MIPRRRFCPLWVSGCTHWFDAQRLDTLYQNSTRTTLVTASGDPVGGWTDLSGNSNHATQSSSSLRGSYNPTGVGAAGHPGVTLDGVDDVLTTPSVLLTNGTIFIVHKLLALAGATNAGFVKLASTANTASGGATDGVIAYTSSSTYTLLRMGAPNTANWFTTFSGWSASAVGDTDQWNWTWTGSQSGLSVHKNRVAKSGTNGNTSYGTPTSLPIHLGVGFGSARANICIGEVIIYNSSLSAANVAIIEGYLRGKWGTA